MHSQFSFSFDISLVCIFESDSKYIHDISSDIKKDNALVVFPNDNPNIRGIMII